MIIRSADDVTGTEHDVTGDGWRSRRILTAVDGMGYSLNDVLIEPGFDLELEYRHHYEACYVVSGAMEITNLETGGRVPRVSPAACTPSTTTTGTSPAAPAAHAWSASSTRP